MFRGKFSRSGRETSFSQLNSLLCGNHGWSCFDIFFK